MRTTLVTLVLLTSTAHAQGPLESLASQSSHAVTLDTGLDTGVTGFVAYAFRLPTSIPLALQVRYGTPLVDPDPIDSSVHVGAEVTLYAHGRWQLRNQLDLFERTTENGVFTGFEVGLADTLRAGYFASAWFAGADLGWEQGLSTYISHSDWYRDTAYPDAEDGWLANPAGILKTGVFGGGHVTRRLLLAGRLGLDIDRTGRTSFLPLVATFTAGWSF